MKIETVDPADDAMLAGWHTAYRAADAHRREHAVPWTLPEAREAFRRTDRAALRQALVAMADGGEVLGAASIVLPLLDNTDTAFFEVTVPPEHRRRGVGSALLNDVLDRVRVAGRTAAVVEVNHPLAEYADHAGRRFATGHGFAEASNEIHHVLDLPVGDAALERLAAQIAPRHEDYRLLGWVDRCPEEWVTAYADLNAGFLAEVPLGELDLENEHFDVQRIRDDEEMRLAQGRSTYVTVAVAPDGSLAGNTVLVVAGHDPGTVFQWGTLVVPAHRGHRLGLALKLANLRTMQHAHPDARVVHTWNAEVNTPMVAVNETMGFRAVERFAEYQRAL